MAATIVGPALQCSKTFPRLLYCSGEIRGRCEKQMAETSEQKPITIKKYANRRLYNTDTSSYVTLDNLAKMVKDGVDFVVVDAKTGQDITRSVLTQIIFEEEAKGPNLLPIGFLRQLIALYGDSLQGLVPNYLDYTMRAFAENRDHMRRTMSEAVGGMFPFTQWEDIGAPEHGDVRSSRAVVGADREGRRRRRAERASGRASGRRGGNAGRAAPPTRMRCSARSRR